jgi:hypothetical protein
MAIAQGTAPTHTNRGHNLPLDIVPAVDHDRSKAPSTPAFFANKSCEHVAPYSCQRSTIGVDGAGNLGIVGILEPTHKPFRPALDPPAAGSGQHIRRPDDGRRGRASLHLPEREECPMGNPVGILTALDPVDRKTLWAAQQWANDATPCLWNTRIVGYKVAPEKQ